MAESLHSYIVCLNFAPPGILLVGAYIAPDAAGASALAALEAAHKMREMDPPPPLVNCLVTEESVEHLRQERVALQTLRGCGQRDLGVRRQVGRQRRRREGEGSQSPKTGRNDLNRADSARAVWRGSAASTRCCRAAGKTRGKSPA